MPRSLASQPRGAVPCEQHQVNLKIGQRGVKVIGILRVVARLLRQKCLPGLATRPVWGRQQDKEAACTFVAVSSQMFTADVSATDEAAGLDECAGLLCSSRFGVLIKRLTGVLWAMHRIRIWLCAARSSGVREVASDSRPHGP